MWITSRQMADIKKTSERTIRRHAEQGKYGQENKGFRYVNGRGRGGKVLQIFKPDNALCSYDQQLDADGQAEQELLELTDAQREIFFARLAAVRGYKEFKASYPKLDKMTAFLQQYNNDHPDSPLNKNRLNHWEKLYDRDGISGLIDRRGTWNKGVSSIPEDVRKVFLAYWGQEKGTKDGGPSIASCYRLTQMNFPDKQLPSMSTFERLARDLPNPVQTFARQGKKAYDDKFGPSMLFLQEAEKRLNVVGRLMQ